jgi:hypothetical protein
MCAGSPGVFGDRLSPSDQTLPVKRNNAERAKVRRKPGAVLGADGRNSEKKWMGRVQGSGFCLFSEIRHCRFYLDPLYSETEMLRKAVAALTRAGAQAGAPRAWIWV